MEFGFPVLRLGYERIYWRGHYFITVLYISKLINEDTFWRILCFTFKNMNLNLNSFYFSDLTSVQLLSRVQIFVTPWITKARTPCPSPSPGVHSHSRPSSQWCHPAISSSVVPFSACPQSLPASDSLPMSQLFAWGGQSTGVSALASFLPKNTQGWSPLEQTG